MLVATLLLFLLGRQEVSVSTRSVREVCVYPATLSYQMGKLPATRKISVIVMKSRTRTACMIVLSSNASILFSSYPLFTGIKDTESLIKISLYQGGRKLISQFMTYDRENARRSLEFMSPPQNSLKLTHIVMHAHNNGYWHHKHLKLVNITIFLLIQL